IISAFDFGLRQKRERVLIVGVRDSARPFDWGLPKIPMQQLSQILQRNVSRRHFASRAIVRKRRSHHHSAYKPAIWHENKSGNVSSYPYSCALRAGASYNYLLVDGKRRLTPREMLRLQGFPDSFKIVTKHHQTRKQAGNAVPVPMVRAALATLLENLEKEQAASMLTSPKRGEPLLAA